jgi:hypothetical protein
MTPHLEGRLARIWVCPIDEVPEAVWYVRPPSGGQYGPARGDVMRKWIGEGRISADSMVWREGWDDWRSGGDVFPYLAHGHGVPRACAGAGCLCPQHTGTCRRQPQLRGSTSTE